MNMEASAKEKAMGLSTQDLGEFLKFFETRKRSTDEVPKETAGRLFRIGLIHPLRSGGWLMKKDIMPTWEYWDLVDVMNERNHKEVRRKIREERGL